MSDAQIPADDLDMETGESAVITKLREQYREAQKELKDLRTKADALAEREAQTRKVKARDLVDSFGYEGFDEQIVLDRIDGEVSQTTVEAALKAIGLTPQTGSSEEPGQPEPESTPKGGVSELGQRVAEAASGSPVKDVAARINAAVSAEEIAAIMSESGLDADHSV